MSRIAVPTASDDRDDLESRRCSDDCWSWRRYECAK